VPGAQLLNFVSEGIARAWLDFCFRQHRFLINTRDGRFHLFVHDPQCPDLILFQVGSHFERLLESVGREEPPGCRIAQETRAGEPEPA